MDNPAPKILLVERDGNDRGTPDLPTELLTEIIELVEYEEDLYALATTSRRLNTLASKRLLKTQGFGPYSKEIWIDYDDDQTIFQALSVFLDAAGTSLEYFSYDCRWSLLKKEKRAQIPRLTQYLSRLLSIRRAHFKFSSLGLTPYMFDLDIDLPPNETSHACITFLHTILGKSCREIHISTESCPSSEDGENMPPGSTPRDWLVDFWPPNHSPPKTQHLETCSIESFPKSLRPLYYHTLLVNGSFITSLSFCRVKPREGGEDLTTMLNELYFPHLRHLSLTTLTVPCDGIMRFLSGHPGTLSTFEYYAVEYTLRPVDPIQSDILEPIFCTLQTLTTSPEYVIDLLPSFASMTGLRNVVIRSGERYHTSTLPGLIELLRRIALCVNKITLTLKFVSSGSVHFKHLLRSFDENHGDNIEILKNLHCIDTRDRQRALGFHERLYTRSLPKVVAVASWAANTGAPREYASRGALFG
ncbi:hypothetical protein BDN70DRAFT_895200 [Pholiota conissans]|uniref:F-box domain-containing protein n=1 Tax=Pholiota conissans TaxID=109636 RepID=A0A9P5Z1N8_9AGAR|nr:hypothetical protein BDN70DRAFT_895200 [Pholiota conissans]